MKTNPRCVWLSLALTVLIQAPRAAAGSISGTVTDLGTGLAGVSVTAVNGTLTNTDTTNAPAEPQRYYRLRWP